MCETACPFLAICSLTPLAVLVQNCLALVMSRVYRFSKCIFRICLHNFKTVLGLKAKILRWQDRFIKRGGAALKNNLPYTSLISFLYIYIYVFPTLLFLIFFLIGLTLLF